MSYTAVMVVERQQLRRPYKFTQNVNNKVQIIVTEHADKLDLKDVQFDDLVAARWRRDEEGLIMDRL